MMAPYSHNSCIIRFFLPLFVHLEGIVPKKNVVTDRPVGYGTTCADLVQMDFCYHCRVGPTHLRWPQLCRPCVQWCITKYKRIPVDLWPMNVDVSVIKHRRRLIPMLRMHGYQNHHKILPIVYYTQLTWAR